ncbi:MAG: SDR family oxidoreductase [Deltaproteobacteria bacterium]|nr:SDR family oxidoreductase [Deltaproteobacteria bacterium]
MDLGVHNATAVITGGSKGMGRASAEHLAKEGARIAVFARTSATLDETIEALEQMGSPDAIGLCVDVADPSAVTRAFSEIEERWEQLNILINTVGPGGTGSIDEFTEEQWTDSFNLGTVSAVRCIHAALPLLRRADWARIVNVSAHSTKRKTPTLIAYTAAKSALTSASKNLAKTLAPEGILVNTVSPGTFLTDGVRSWLEGMATERGLNPNRLEDLNRVIDEDFGEPCDLGRAGLPEEIGAVIAFAASRMNSYMTGTNINVDGGSDFT